MAGIVFDKDANTGEIRNAKIHVGFGGKRHKIYIPKKHYKDRRLLSTLENCLNDISEFGDKENWPARVTEDLLYITSHSPKLAGKLEKLGIFAIDPGLLMKDLLEDYKKALKGRVNATTFKHQCHYLPILADELTGDLRKYTSNNIKQVFDNMKQVRTGLEGQVYAYSSKKSLLSVLRCFYQWCVETGQCESNPTDFRFKKTARDRSKEADKMMLDEETINLHKEWLLKKDKLKVASLLTILSTFGCRAGEIGEIIPKNIRGDKIKRSFSKHYDKPRYIPLLPEQKEAIEWVKTVWPEFFQWSQQDNMPSRVAHLLSKYCDGMNCNALRRYVSLKIREKYGSLVESQLLGHSEDVARRIYQVNQAEKDRVAFDTVRRVSKERK